MSGNFVQRGDVAVMNKIDRARLAVKSGVDLVIEIPAPYCLAPAEIYASGGVYLLNGLGAVDEISFGSECGDIELLWDTVNNIEQCIERNSDEIRNLMAKGYTYPKALTSIISGIDKKAGEIMSQPNNTLALEYLKAIKKYSPNMKCFTVKRKSVHHDSQIAENEFASASYLREKIPDNFECFERYTNSSWSKAVKESYQKGEIADIKRLERVILYKLRMITPDEIRNIYDINSGLDNRIYSSRTADSLDELLFAVKSKNCTMARIRRALLNILIGVTKEDMQHKPPYIRILASNKRGMEILSRAKKSATLPYNTSLAKLAEKSNISRRFAELEARASDIYGLTLGNIQSAQKDYRAKFVIDFE